MNKKKEKKVTYIERNRVEKAKKLIADIQEGNEFKIRAEELQATVDDLKKKNGKLQKKIKKLTASRELNVNLKVSGLEFNPGSIGENATAPSDKIFSVDDVLNIIEQAKVPDICGVIDCDNVYEKLVVLKAISQVISEGELDFFNRTNDTNTSVDLTLDNSEEKSEDDSSSGEPVVTE